MEKKHMLLAVLSGIFIGFSIVIISHVTKTVHPFVYTTLSTLAAIPLLFTISFFFGGKCIKEILAEKKRDFTLVLFERFIIATIILTFGMSLALAIRAVFVVQIEPVFVFLWSVLLLKERVRKSKVMLIITLMAGAFLLTTGGNLGVFNSLLLGDLLIILALVLLSHSYLGSAKLMGDANPIKLNMGFMAASLPVFAALALLLLPLESFFVGWYYFFLIIAASVCFNVIGFPLWLICLKKIKPWVLASSVVVQAVAGAVLAYFWLGQTLSEIQIIGGILILISVYLIGLKG